ncbi:MAG: hypothetical protein ACLR5H_10440 [Oscillospiraceae bacterium]
MVSFLQIIDNPRQDVPLIAVLRSPLFGFSADRLALIRALQPEGIITMPCAWTTAQTRRTSGGCWRSCGWRPGT